MFIFDDSPEHQNDAAESFIGENLSIYQAQWLQSQCEALGQPKGQMLEAILKEWFADHPPDVWEKLHEGEIARRAMSVFILRHYKEFLPVPCSR